ncbi:MAG TPA: twin-arginine translocase TatA/TatE family subunit [Opitutaceae bacterium]|jgi:sec-independent protein translocase protein TatA
MHDPRQMLGFLDSLGGGEMIVVLVVVLIFFGGEKMPEFAKGLGKAIREFKKAAGDVEQEFKRAMNEVPETPAIALKPAASVVPRDTQEAAPPPPTPPSGDRLIFPGEHPGGHGVDA